MSDYQDLDSLFTVESLNFRNLPLVKSFMDEADSFLKTGLEHGL